MIIEYVQVSAPDEEKLKALINEIKGTRNMSQFTDAIKLTTPDIKVSPATLSRACNCGNNPVSTELLKAIADVAENPEKAMEQLIEANGMRTKEQDEALAQRETQQKRRDALMEVDRTVTMILQSEIVNRGYPVRKLSGLFNGYSLHGYVAQKDRVFPRNYNFGFSVSGLRASTWKFCLDSMSLPDDSAKDPIEGHVGNFINRVASVFAGDNFESELYESERYSFVFVDRKLYEAFLQRLTDNNLQVNGLMTAILVDLDGLRVVEETQLNRYDGEIASSFFKQPVIETEKDESLIPPFDLTE